MRPDYVPVCVHVCVCGMGVDIYYNGDGRCYPSTPLGSKFKCRKMQIERTQCNMIIFLVGDDTGKCVQRRWGAGVCVQLGEGHSFCF